MRLQTFPNQLRPGTSRAGVLMERFIKIVTPLSLAIIGGSFIWHLFNFGFLSFEFPQPRAAVVPLS